MGDPNCNNRGWCGEGWPRKGLLSSLSMTYDDLARDLDANLAQIDMDDDLDMHSVLTTVNNYSDSQSDASSKVGFQNQFQVKIKKKLARKITQIQTRRILLIVESLTL